MGRSWISAVMMVGLLFGACAARPVRQPMTAAQHREAAERERAAAREHVQIWQEDMRPRRGIPFLMPNDPAFIDSIFWFDERSFHFQEAERHAARANAHDAAARELERERAPRLDSPPLRQ